MKPDRQPIFYHCQTDDPAVNVTLDAVFLDQPGPPVARLWRNPLSIVLGYNQDPRQSVNLYYCWRNRIPLVRRITGGGTVLHDLGNLNFSLILPRDLLAFDINTRRLYARLSEIPISALQSLGIPASLSPLHDIVVKGKKVSGLAMRIARERLLFHGTILWKTPVEIIERALIAPVQRGFDTHHRYISSLAALNFCITIEDFTRALLDALKAVFGVSPTLSSPDPETLALARAVAPRWIIDPVAVDPTLRYEKSS